MVAYAFNPSTQQAETGELQASQDSVRLYLKTKQPKLRWGLTLV